MHLFPFQTGQAVNSWEVLSGVKEPLLPVIDHPALLPLVQDYIKQRQQQSEQNVNHSVGSSSNPSQQALESTSVPQSNIQQQPQTSGKDDDEFDDFVSVGGPVSGSIPGEGTQISGPTLQQPFLTPPSLPGPLSQLRPTLVDKMKAMNLPKVGVSPEMSPTTSFDHTGDDDFDDFQSANPASESVTGSASVMEQTAPQSEASIPSALPLEPVRSGDKYAVFRELEAPSGEISSFSLGQQTNSDSGSANDADESFGDFCSSDAAPAANPPNSSLSTLQPSSASSSFPPILSQPTNGSGTNNTSPISFEIYSTPPEALPESSADGYFEADFGSAFESMDAKSPNNYADIHEAMKRAEQVQKQKAESEWSDPFGEFEEGPNVSCSTSSLPTKSWPVPHLMVSVEIY